MPCVYNYKREHGDVWIKQPFHSGQINRTKNIVEVTEVKVKPSTPYNAKADDAVTHQLERNIGKLYDLGELYNRKFPKNSTTISSSAALHDLYYLQPHNTFDHDASLTAWLNSGYRSLELDVIDRGDWEKETKGPYVSHNFEAEKNNCKRDGKARLGDCFQQIKDWIDRNGTDVPIMLYIDMKASWDPASAWKSDEMAQLNRWIGNSILGDYLFTYKDLADHIEAKSRDRMRVNLRGRGWPLIASMRNKVVVVLTGGPRGNVNDTMGKAVWKHSTLANMFVFFCPDVDAQDEKEISGNIDSMSSRESKAFVCANIEMADHAEDTLNRSVEWNQLNPRRHSEAQRPALSGARAEPERREGPGVALFAPSGPPDSARKRLGPFGSEPNRPLRAAQGMPAGAPGTARGAWRAIRPGVSLREAAPEGTPPPASGSPAPSWDARSGGPARP